MLNDSDFTDQSLSLQRVSSCILPLQVPPQIHNKEHWENARNAQDDGPGHNVSWLVLRLEQLRAQNVAKAISNVIKSNHSRLFGVTRGAIGGPDHDHTVWNSASGPDPDRCKKTPSIAPWQGQKQDAGDDWRDIGCDRQPCSEVGSLGQYDGCCSQRHERSQAVNTTEKGSL